jgi:hypothetical protein
MTVKVPPCPGSYQVEYFDNADLTNPPVLVQCEEGPIGPFSFDWLATPPPAGVGPKFSVRWRGAVYIAAGTYTVTANADDGIRVKFGGQWVIDEWHDHSLSDGGYTQTVTLTMPRNTSEIIVEYYENGEGAAAIQFDGPF